MSKHGVALPLSQTPKDWNSRTGTAMEGRCNQLPYGSHRQGHNSIKVGVVQIRGVIQMLKHLLSKAKCT